MIYQCLDNQSSEYILSIRSNVPVSPGDVVTHPETHQRYLVVSTEPVDHRMPSGPWYARIKPIQ